MKLFLPDLLHSIPSQGPLTTRNGPIFKMNGHGNTLIYTAAGFRDVKRITYKYYILSPCFCRWTVPLSHSSSEKQHSEGVPSRTDRRRHVIDKRY